MPVARSRRSLRRLVMASLMAVLATCSVWFHATSARADAEAVRKSVVHLHTEWSAQVSITYQDGTTTTDKATSGGSCTGFFASTSGDISTAGHCVDDARAVNKIKVAYIRDLIAKGAVIKDQATYNAYYDAIKVLSNPSRRVLAYQPQGMKGAVLQDPVDVQVVGFKNLDQGDHALLRLNGFETPTPAVSFASADPGSGTDVAAMGFPGVVADLTDAYRKPASVFFGKVSGFAPRQGVPFVEIGIVMSPGMSGGPVFDAKTDQVYGNVSFGPSDESGETNDINFATDTTDMVAFLKSHGVQVNTGSTPEGGATADPSSAPTNPVPTDATPSALGTDAFSMALGLVVLGGVGALVWFLVRRKRKPQTAPFPSYPAQYGQPGQPNQQQHWPQGWQQNQPPGQQMPQQQPWTSQPGQQQPPNQAPPVESSQNRPPAG